MEIRYRSLVVALLGLCLAGCSTKPRMNYGNVTLVKASGTVKLNGQPLPNAVVTFEAEDGQFSYAMTDSSGYYQLQFDSVMAGVRPGRKLVRISTTRKILGLNDSTEEGDGPNVETAQASAPAKVELVPDKYNSQSQLNVEVTESQTRFDFELAST